MTSTPGSARIAQARTMPTHAASARTAPATDATSRRLAAWPRRLAALRRAASQVTVVAAAALLPACLPLPRPTPIADRPIDLAGRCAQIEDDGYREDATLRVEDNIVRALSWRLSARRGACRFELAEFRQTRRRPHIELQATDGSGCKLMVWQAPQQVTLAHAGCESRCTGTIYDEAWPVLFDPGTGRCARRD